jgi:hypothetical protein
MHLSFFSDNPLALATRVNVPVHSGEEIAAITLNIAQFTDIPASAEVPTEISFNFPITGEMPVADLPTIQD